MATEFCCLLQSTIPVYAPIQILFITTTRNNFCPLARKTVASFIIPVVWIYVFSYKSGVMLESGPLCSYEFPTITCFQYTITRLGTHYASTQPSLFLWLLPANSAIRSHCHYIEMHHWLHGEVSCLRSWCSLSCSKITRLYGSRWFNNLFPDTNSCAICNTHAHSLFILKLCLNLHSDLSFVSSLPYLFKF
jgi:hypothetical protein